MKREKFQTCFISLVLSFLLSLGGIGCLITGFQLNVDNMAGLVVACVFFAAGSTLCFQLKRGGTIILCLLALLFGFLWRSEEAMNQLLSLLYQITRRYHMAYGWGVMEAGEIAAEETGVGYPLAMVACLVAVCVSLTVCRRRSAIPAVLLSLVPLFACMVVTDTVPKEGYLYILALALIVLILTNNLRRNAPDQGNTLTFIVTLPVAAVLGVLFLAVPQDSYVNQTIEIQEKILEWAESMPLLLEDISEDISHTGNTGSKMSEVDLENLGRRIRYTYPVMDVQTPASGTLYLREQDYDSYDGKGWTASPRRTEVFGDPTGLGQYVGTVKITTRRPRDTIYLPYYPGQIQTLSGGRISNDSGVDSYEFIWRKPPESWEAYIAGSSLLSSTVRIPGSLDNDTKGESAGDGGKNSDYLKLPDETKKKAKELLKSILTDEETDWEKAVAIGSYVKNSAVYDLNTEKMPADRDDFAIWFLEEGETGYCVHFATAATVLLRAAGVRARYVTGYMTQAVEDRMITVIAGDAHAWTEYYDPVVGMWIVLEATPADPEGEEMTEPSETATEGTEATGSEPSAETTQTTEVTEPQDTATPTDAPADDDSQTSDEPSKAAAWLVTLAKVLLGAGAAVLAVTGQRSLRLNLRRGGLRRGKSNEQALTRWREAERLYRLLKQAPPWELEKLAQKAKFSQHTLTAEELKVFDAHIAAARQACEEKPWYWQLIYRYVFAAY